ncbi:MAG: hypothetical protein JXR15_14480 [Shimia sp.]|uniref:TAXI family TRAP transporter solute-binding subunit n=1 Tax=Shimia sp. TaxID=1954381 RepID=UPI003B8C8D51
MRLWIFITTLSLAVCVSLVLFMLLPPNTVRLAAGTQGGAYTLMAERYQEVLARDGIDVQIVHTNGSVDNAEMMSGNLVDAAFLQAGVGVVDGTAESIGGVFYEPMIFLAHSGHDIPSNPALWRDLTIAAGKTGSGTAVAFSDFQSAVGMAKGANTLVDLGFSQAIFALRAGDIDMAFFVSSIEAPYLRQAFGYDDIDILHLSYTNAIARHLDYADLVEVPTGGVSLNPVQPTETRQLLALKAQLVIDPNLHPALVNRLTMAAKELHRGHDVLTPRGTFPEPRGIGIPENSVARQLIEDGPSTWHSLLPYWMAAQVNRLFLLTLPILFLLLPLLRVLPMIYAYFRGWQVWKHYGRIREIEAQMGPKCTAEELTGMSEELEEVDHRISQLKLPPAYRQTAYHARMHIDLVQKRIKHLETQLS